MGKRKERGTFEKCFERTLAAGRAGEVSAMIALAPHPRALHIAHARKGDLKGGEAYAPWFGPEAPWLGAAAWVFPKHFQDELIEAGGGALFSHANCEAESDEAFVTILGPVGACVAGSGWNPHAFERQGWPYRFDVGTFDIQCGEGRGDGRLKRGDERPSWWRPPMPMVGRVWRAEDPPSLAPDLGRVASALAHQMRAEAAQAIFEEVGAEGERAALALGTVVELPGRLARHFARQDHPMGGDARLEGSDLAEALEALDMARAGFEAWWVGRGAAPGAASRPALRV